MILRDLTVSNHTYVMLQMRNMMGSSEQKKAPLTFALSTGLVLAHPSPIGLSAPFRPNSTPRNSQLARAYRCMRYSHLHPQRTVSNSRCVQKFGGQANSDVFSQSRAVRSVIGTKSYYTYCLVCIFGLVGCCPTLAARYNGL